MLGPKVDLFLETKIVWVKIPVFSTQPCTCIATLLWLLLLFCRIPFPSSKKIKFLFQVVLCSTSGKCCFFFHKCSPRYTHCPLLINLQVYSDISLLSVFEIFLFSGSIKQPTSPEAFFELPI